jgi:hypothetical protein
MPRGYVGDTTHDAILDLLVANHALVKDGDSVREGTAVNMLDMYFSELVEKNLFSTERAVISNLLDVRVSKTMLGGG